MQTFKNNQHNFVVTGFNQDPEAWDQVPVQQIEFRMPAARKAYAGDHISMGLQQSTYGPRQGCIVDVVLIVERIINGQHAIDDHYSLDVVAMARRVEL